MPTEEPDSKSSATFGKNFDEVMADRLREADCVLRVDHPAVGWER